jgi:arabinosaccharide transport system permease protein
VKFSVNRKILTVLLVLFFLAITIIVLFPFYYLIMASLKDSKDLFKDGLDLMIRPSTMTIKNYVYTLTGNNSIYLFWYRNSIGITILETVCSLFLSSMVGYALGVYEFKGKNLIFTLVLFTMMIPLEILMLPLYKLLVSFHIINTYAGVILPFVVSPSAIFFFRQYASALPRELMDAGRIDGCTEYGIFFKIMVPLMKPAIGAMTILISMQSWNSFIWPLIALRTSKMFTLPIGLASLMSPYGNNYNMLISGAVLAIIPIVIVFLFNQRAFISGLAAGGVKG